MKASHPTTPSVPGRVARSRIFWIAVLLLIGGYFRVTAVQETVVDGPIRADAMDYYLGAYNLVHYGTYSRSRSGVAEPPTAPEPDAYRSPGVTLLIAPFMSLWPDHTRIVTRVQFVNVALGLLGVVAIFFAASVVLPLAAAVAVGLLTACGPHLISLSVYMLSETPGACLVAVLLGAAAFGVPASRGARVVYFLMVGAAVGLLALFRPVFVAFAPLMALAYPERRDKWQALFFGCIGAALVFGPWVVRNILNVPPGGPSLLAHVLLEGSYRDFMFNGDKSTFPYGIIHDPRSAELEMSLRATVEEVAKRFIADPGGSLLWYLVQKPVYLFQWNNIDGMGDVFVYRVLATPFKTNELFIAVHDSYKAVHVVLVLLAMIGAAAAWWTAATRSLPREKLHVLRMASLVLVFLYLIHLPFVVNTRYAIPVYPAMYLLAVFTAVLAARAVWSYGRSSSTTRGVEPIPVTATPAKQPSPHSPKRPTPGHRKGGGKRRA